MSKKQIIPYITSSDISQFPDQASYKLNLLVDAVNRLINQD